MKSTIACLLVLAVAAQAQWFGGLGYGYGGYYGGYGYPGYFPYAAGTVRTVPVTAAAPATLPTAAPAVLPAVYGYPSYTSTQYHSQDELGQASFGYAHPGQAATNLRDGFGNQIGSYAYINPEGKEVRVSYTADHRGFRVLSNALPEAPVANLVAPLPVQDTPEVAAAKAAHLAAKTAPVAAAPVVPAADLPVPVQDTPEVAAAKAEFAAKYEAAKAAAAAAPARRKRQVFAYGTPYLNFPYATPYAAPYAYAAAPAVVAAPAQPVREATLTKTILTPGHAVSYRVD